MRDPNTLASALRRRLATNVRRLRREQGMTQEQLAEVADLDRRFITKLESTDGANASLRTLTKLANAFGVDVPALLAPPRR